MNGNQQNQDGQGPGGPARVSFGTKATYIGTGVLIGLILYPFVRKAIAKLQPQADKLFDELTGKAEGFAEKAADLMARAKDSLGGRGSDGPDTAHDHDHDRSSNA